MRLLLASACLVNALCAGEPAEISTEARAFIETHFITAKSVVKNEKGEEVGPWHLVWKEQPATGKQDDGEYLEIDMSDLPAKTSTATVTIDVNEGH